MTAMTPARLWRDRPVPSPLSIALCAALLMGTTTCAIARTAHAPVKVAADTAAAAPDAASTAAPAAAPVAAASAELPAGARRYEVSLKQMGATIPMILRGIDGSNTLPFDIRADEVVTSARLHLKYAYSPALLPDLSHINVLVNGEVAGTIAVPKATAGTNLESVVDIPPQLVTQFNNLNVQLIGHYTMDCEDPLHTSLWANISNRSTLEVVVTPLALVNDLSILPLPFFDPRDARQLNLPFVFTAAPDNGTLESAGTVASWFGALASYRGAKFPSSVNKIPDQGNAVLVTMGEMHAMGVELPAPNGPTITILSNPNDPHGKLLVIGGRDAKELKQAADALVTGSKSLTGQHAVITKLVDLEPRKPYDAPRWLPSDRPVKIGELATPTTLNVTGFSPRSINVDMRLPPDLFAWRDPGLPLHLKYRYTPQPISTNSSLTVSANGQFLRSLALPSIAKLDGGEGLLAQLKTDSSYPVETDMRIPLQVLPSNSQLQFRYQYDYIKQGQCRDVIIDNVRGAIEPDSTIDISGYPHYIAMPDLAAFRNSGFPFTRMADLSETTVVMPSSAGAAEVSAYLGVVGRLSESTGYPATGITVTRSDQSDALKDKDLIVIASGDDQPLLQKWAGQMPVSMNGQSRSFNLSDLVYKAWSWIIPNPHDDVDHTRSTVSFTTDGASVVFAGFESPVSSGRSVVAISSSRPEGMNDALRALLSTDESTVIQGSVAVVRGNDVESLVADQTYHVGSLGVWRTIEWTLWRHPALLVLLLLLGIALLSIPLYFALRARARQRLNR